MISQKTSIPALFTISGLWLSWLSPLGQAYFNIPDLTGIELIFYIIAVIGSPKQFITQDFTNFRFSLFIPFLFICVISAIYNQVDFRSLLFFVALISILPILLILLISLDFVDRQQIVKHALLIGILQILFSVFQIATHPIGTVDHVQGSLVGTGAGGHIAPFAALLSCTYLALEKKFGSIAKFCLILFGLLVCYLGDAKQVILVFLLIISLYFSISKSQFKFYLPRVFAALFIVFMVSLYINGVFGGIKPISYINLSVETKGGKIAVANQIVSPNSDFHKEVNYLVGAGPAQSVGRAALLTVSNSFSPVAPASKFGIPSARFYDYFTTVSKGMGYVGDSSFTSPTSSMLGIMGDIGLLGFAAYIFLIFKLLRVCMEIGVMRSSLSLISFGVYIFVLSFFGEWLENPPAIAFAVIIFASDNFNRKVSSK